MRLLALRGYWRPLSYSGASQILGSLTNFTIAVFLVRMLSQEEFGLYSLLLASILTGAGLIGAFLGTPFTVNVADVPQHERACHAVNQTLAVIAISVLMVLPIMIVAEVSSASTILDRESVTTISVTGGGICVAYCTRDILTRIAFALRIERAALGAAVGTAMAVGAGLAILWIFDLAMNVSRALAIYGVGQVVGVSFIVRLLSLPWRSGNYAGLKAALRKSWPEGRWSVLSGGAYILRTQVYNFMVPAILGVAALGQINAARVLVTPAMMVLPPIKDVLLPRLADERKNGIASLLRVSSVATAALAFGGLIYSAALLMLLPWLTPIILGPNYGDLTWVVVAWSATTFALTIREGYAMSLQAVRGFRLLLIMNLSFATLAALLCYVLAIWFEAPGAVWAIAVAELGLGLMLWTSVRRWGTVG